MILLLGKTLTFWTGILTGLFFVLSFFGCRCLNEKCPKVLAEVAKHHTLLMKLAFVLFLIHATLAILPIFGIYI
jgi:uncharacterized membrane protein YdjX (TVP38/TMEM64 family)